MNNYYVYFHINPLTNKVFYVGEGKGARAKSKARNKYWHLQAKQYGYIVDIVDNNLTKKEALEKESFYINWFGLDNLTNIIPSGGVWNKGLKLGPLSEPLRKKLSEVRKGIRPKNYDDMTKSKLKPILKYDLDMNLITEYDSIKDAMLYNSSKSNIGAVCRGERYSAGGFIYKFKNKQ